MEICLHKLSDDVDVSITGASLDFPEYAFRINKIFEGIDNLSISDGDTFFMATFLFRCLSSADATTP